MKFDNHRELLSAFIFKGVNWFVTGSQAYELQNPFTSDIDICFLHKDREEVDEIIKKYPRTYNTSQSSENKEFDFRGFCIDIGEETINLIPLKLNEYKAWKEATKYFVNRLEKRDYVFKEFFSVKENRVKHFREIRDSFLNLEEAMRL